MEQAEALYVRSPTGRYARAEPETVLATARQIVGVRMKRGEKFTDPQAVCRYFQDKLAGQEREVFAAAMLDTRRPPAFSSGRL